MKEVASIDKVRSFLARLGSVFFLVPAAVLLIPTEQLSAAPISRALQSVIDGARQEGTLNLYAPSTLKPAGAHALKQGIKDKYGVDLNVVYTGSGSMTRDVAKVITELSTGAPPSWDIMLVTDAHYVPMVKNKFLEPIDFKGLDVDPNAIFYGVALAYATQFVAPAYNTQLIKPADVPTKWEDLLNPKWKGKIGITTATHHWGRLAQAWGDEKTTKFVKALASQQLVKATTPATYTRLQLGEIAIAATLTDSFIDTAKKSGAPVAFVPSITPIIATQYLAAPLKGTRHKNAALLLVAFLASPEGQATWNKAQGQTSMFINGSPAYKYVHDKEAVVALDTKFALGQYTKLTRKYGKLLGFR